MWHNVVPAQARGHAFFCRFESFFAGFVPGVVEPMLDHATNDFFHCYAEHLVILVITVLNDGKDKRPKVAIHPVSTDLHPDFLFENEVDFDANLLVVV